MNSNTQTINQSLKETTQPKIRKKWIDMLRALAMFFVIFGHLHTGINNFALITGPIKMPLFYFLTGYLIKDSKKIKDFVKGIALRLFIPYLVFSLFYVEVISKLIQHNVSGALDHLYKFFYGDVIWFIPSFFITQVIFYLLLKLFKNKRILFGITSAILFGVGFVLGRLEILEFWCINTALTGVLFLYIGYIFKDKEEVIEKHTSLKTIIPSILAYIGLILLSIKFYPNKTIDFHNANYYSIPICLSLSLFGFYVCTYLAKKIENISKLDKLNKLIVIMGQNTLLIYLLQDTFFMIYKGIIGIVYKPEVYADNLPYCIAIAILTCISGTLVSVICTKYFPFLVLGKTKKKENKKLKED